MDESAISRVVRVAAGPFAPGHLGELTQQVPFEMIDAVLAETGAVQRRVRALPARVVVYLLLAGCLFAELGYRQVWQRLLAGLVCAIDGTIMSVADSPANLTTLVKQAGGRCGGGAFPTLRLLSVLACGTRTVIDAVFGPASTGEVRYAAQLAARLDAGLLILADRAFAAGYLLCAITDRGSHLLVRVRTGATAPRLPMLRRLRDGSYQSLFGGRNVRVIEAEITISTSAGTTTGAYRLITTLLDPQHHPATELIRLYHERWEIETAFLELKSSLVSLSAQTLTGLRNSLEKQAKCVRLLHPRMISDDVVELMRTAKAREWNNP
ncbi:MAG: transposase domain-containing protein [Actinoplanes sp.]